MSAPEDPAEIPRHARVDVVTKTYSTPHGTRGREELEART